MADAEDVRTRVEDALRRAASSAYSAAHGVLDEVDEDDAPRWRFRVSPRVAVTATLVVALVGALVVFTPRGGASFSPAAAADVSGEAPSASASPAAFGAGSPLPAGSVVVHVAGAVATPGLYTLDAGARVADAVAAAGGGEEDADLEAVNLARVVVDGEQVHIPALGEAVSVAAQAGGPAAPININAADAATLEDLPGVGPVLAARIVAYRDRNGPFASVDALDGVSGIGPTVLEEIRAAATV